MSVLYACVLGLLFFVCLFVCLFVFCCVWVFFICPCSAQLSVYNMERCSRNTLIIIITSSSSSSSSSKVKILLIRSF